MSRGGGISITLNAHNHPGGYASPRGSQVRVNGYSAMLSNRTPGYVSAEPAGVPRTMATPLGASSPRPALHSPHAFPGVALYPEDEQRSVSPPRARGVCCVAASPLAFELALQNTSRVEPLALGRYSVARRAGSPGADDHSLNHPVYPQPQLPRASPRGATSPRHPSPSHAWHRAHLSVPRLPDAALASPPLPHHRHSPDGPPARRLGTHAIRVNVLTSEGLSHGLEVPNGLQSTVNEVLQSALAREPSRLRSREKDAPYLEFVGRRLHPYDTLEEVGVCHLSTLVLQRKGDVRVEPAAAPQTSANAVADFVTRFTGSGGKEERRGRYRDPFFPSADQTLETLPGTKTPPTARKPLIGLPSHPPDAFEFGTPVEQFMDTNTKRVVLQDAAGTYAVVYEEGIVPLQNHPLRFYLIDLLKEKDPSRLSQVDWMLWNAEGREDELLQRLYEKYNLPDVLYEDYVQHRKATRPFEPGAVVEKFIDEQTFERVFVDDKGQYCVYPYEPGLPIVPMADHPTRQWLVDFFRHHARRRLPETDYLLWEHQWQEDKLRQLCTEVYGPAPIPPYREYVANHQQEKLNRSKLDVNVPPTAAPRGVDAALDPVEEKDSLVDAGLPPVPDDHPLRLYLIDYYTEKNDLEKMALVEKFVRDYDGFEETLLERVRFQSGESNALVFENYVDHARQRRNEAFVPGKPVDDFLDENTFTSVFLDEFGQYCVVPLVDKYTVVPMSFHPMRDWLIDFFRHHSKRDLAEVDFLLWEHQWQEERLRKTCLDAYGKAPIPPYEEYLRKKLKKEADEAAKRRVALETAKQFPDPNLVPRKVDVVRQIGDWKEMRSAAKKYYYNEKEAYGTFDIKQTPFTSHDDESVFTDDSDPLGEPLDHALLGPVGAPDEDEGKKKKKKKKGEDDGEPKKPKGKGKKKPKKDDAPA